MAEQHLRQFLERLQPLTNSGHASWFEFASEIFRLTGRRINLEPVSSSAFQRKAKRPAKAVLLNRKAASLRPWQAALAEYLEEQGVTVAAGAQPSVITQNRPLMIT